MIRYILFDFGGVILQHRRELIPYILTNLFPDNSDLVLQAWDEKSNSLYSGMLTTRQLLDELKSLVNSSYSADQLMDRWRDIYIAETKDVNNYLLTLIDKLRKIYKVYLFTNTIDVHDEINSERGIYEKFDRVYKSFEQGYSKLTEIDAYKDVLKEIGAKPEECVLIDDRESNIKQATSLGIKGIHYRANAQLIEDLGELNIKI